MNYDVGQVLYLLSKKNNKIIPSRVDAVITIKKITGEEITHEMSVPGVDRITILEKLDVIPFSNIADLRDYMLNILEKKIDSEISAVTAAAQNAWPNQSEATVATTDHNKVENSLSLQQDLMQVALPNGGTARVHLPKELM